MILRKLRGKKSIAEVAQALDISDSALSAYENESRVPRDELKIKLAAYYHRSVAYIFFPPSSQNVKEGKHD